MNRFVYIFYLNENWQTTYRTRILSWNYQLPLIKDLTGLKNKDKRNQLFCAEYIGGNAIYTQFHSVLPFSTSYIQPVNSLIRNVSRFLVISNCHKLSAKFFSGTLSVIEKVGLLSVFNFLLKQLLNSS